MYSERNKRNEEENILKGKKGITLIALVITIIVLLILAGVSIAMLTGNNGILSQAQNANEQTDIGKEKEQIALAYNGIKTKKEGGDVTAGELDTELKANGTEATASGNGTLAITFSDSDRTYTIDINGNIILITGNAKEILDNASIAYGKIVSNYDIDGSTGVNWKIFNSDGVNIYLIAGDYINYDKIPNSKENNKLNQSDSFQDAAFFTNILDDYNGSSDITSDNSAYKWLNKYYEKQYTSEYNNMKAVAYMLDTNVWNTFKEDTASYAIGGPTLEMLFDSYNKKYGTQYECQATSKEGYLIRKTANSEWEARITGLLETNDELYTISNQNNALSYWIASPSNYNDWIGHAGFSLLAVYYIDSGVTYSSYYADDVGFRPIVCLNSDIDLILQEDGTYKIR